MADTVTCPVCERPGVPLQSTKCPQCDADLTCFQALDSLAVQQTAHKEVQETRDTSGSRRAVLLLLLLLVLLGSFFSYFFFSAKHDMRNLAQRVSSLKTDLQVAQQKSELAEQLCVFPGFEKTDSTEEDNFAEDDPLVYEEDLEGNAGSADGENVDENGESVQYENEQLFARSGEPVALGLIIEEVVKEKQGEKNIVLEEPIPVVKAASVKRGPTLQQLEEQWAEKTFLYLVKTTDTLWELAERFYGDGKYYPVIMEQNPKLVISNIHDEESLRFLRDRTMLEDMYTRRMEWREGLMLWKHQVQVGETRQSIEKRFASPGTSGRVLYDKEPNISPGATVRVILH